MFNNESASMDDYEQINAACLKTAGEESPERERRELKELEDIYHCAPVGLCVLNRELRYVRINDYLANMNGLPAADHIGRTVREIVPFIADGIEKLTQRIFSTGKSELNVEFSGTSRAKVARHLISHWIPMTDNTGAVISINVVAYEITEQKRAEKALRKSEEFLGKVLDSSLAGLYIFNLKRGRTDFINQQFTELTGYALEDLNRKSLHDLLALFHPKDVRKVVEHIQAVRRAADGEAIEIEYRFRNANGRWIWCLARNSVFERRADGSVEQMIGTFLDITDRKHSVEALQDSYDELEAIYRGIPDGMLIADAKTRRLVKTNPAMCRMLGYSEDELLTMSVEDIHPATALQDVLRKFQDGVEGRQNVVEEMPLLRKDGTLLYTDVGHEPLAYYEGTYLIGFFHDLTRRKRQMEAVQQSQTDLKRAQEVAQLGSWRLNIHSNTVTWSDEGCRIFGIPEGPPQDYEMFLEMVHPEDRSYVDMKWKAALRGEPYEIEHRIIVDDTVKWVREKAYLEFDDGGRLLGGFGISQDVTERKLIEKELKQSHNELELRVRQRTKELSDTLRRLEEYSDKLRQLTTELIVTEQRERQRLAQILHDGLQQMLVGAIFQLESIKYGRNGLDELNRLRQTLNEASETSRSLAIELSPPVLLRKNLCTSLEWLVSWMRDMHGLHVNLKCPKSPQPLEEQVLLVLFQAVRELLFNVKKHAGVKKARIEVHHQQERVLIHVEDEGAGFKADSINKGSGKSGGFGLFGVRERILMMGGQMEIDSKPGRGSRFKIILPKSLVTKAPVQGSTFEQLEELQVGTATMHPLLKYQKADEAMKIHIFLVDDHEVVRQGIADLIRREPDFEVAGEASDGESAVRLVRKIRPDVILMDINMPVMDGIQATKIIHSEFRDIRIIGFSLYDEEVHKKEMLEAGAVGYFPKHGSAKGLIETIRACVGDVRSFKSKKAGINENQLILFPQSDFQE